MKSLTDLCSHQSPLAKAAAGPHPTQHAAAAVLDIRRALLDNIKILPGITLQEDGLAIGKLNLNKLIKQASDIKKWQDIY